MDGQTDGHTDKQSSDYNNCNYYNNINNELVPHNILNFSKIKNSNDTTVKHCARMFDYFSFKRNKNIT